MTEIRRLTKNDSERYKAICLERLLAHPESFGGSYEESVILSTEFFAEHIENSFIFGAFDNDDLVATMSVYLKSDNKVKHCAQMYGVYAKLNYRGKGLIKQLIDDITRALPSYVEQIKSSVESTNKAAIKTYENIGFKMYGVEKNGLKLDGRYYDIAHIIKYLRNSDTLCKE